MVTVASAGFLCSPGERDKVKKEVKKALNSKAFFAKPLPSHAMPTAHPTEDTMPELAARNEIAPVETTDSYRVPSESIPRIPRPMSPPRAPAAETTNRSPTRDTKNISASVSNSMPLETRTSSLVSIAPMRSHISSPQENKGNDTPQAPPMPSKIPSYRKPSTGLNQNALPAGSANLKPATQMPKLQDYAKSKWNDEDDNGKPIPIPSIRIYVYQFKILICEFLGSKITMPPTPPKLPNFSKAETSTSKNNGPMMSNPAVKATPVAPTMPSKMPSYQKPSIGLSNSALSAGRGGLRPAQTQNSNPIPTQLHEKPEAAEMKRPSNPITAAGLMASKETLRPVSQMTKPPVLRPQTNQKSYKPLHQTSGATNEKGSGVTNLARNCDDSAKTPTSPIPKLSEFAMISQRRNRINSINWDQFDTSARKLQK